MLESQTMDHQASERMILKEKSTVPDEIVLDSHSSEPLDNTSRNRASSPSTPLSRVVTTTDDSIIFTNPSSGESENTTTSQSNNIPTNNEDDHNHELVGNDILHDGVETFYPASDSLAGVSKINELNDNDEETQDETTNLLKPEEQHNNNLHGNNATATTTNNNDNDSHFRDQLDKYTFGERKNSFTDNGSYIQDDNDETVLLNTIVRRNRTSRATGLESNVDPSSIRHRHSIATTNSKNQDTDTATREIERMRNSVLSKRENKRRQRTLQDDDKVLVGNKVSEGHVNYVIAYNMLTGIRVAVSRCSGIMKPLSDQDFKINKKLAFDVSGNELTPSSKYDFKFKDYAPTVFRELRQIFGLDPADYLVSLTSKYILSELNSPGKSGSFFYFSRDYRFIIKTIHPAEHRHLRRMLKDYHHHVKNNPNTLISQFYGLHRVKMPLHYGNLKRRKIYFIVMNNLFPPHRDIHRTYDLKGSTLGRFTPPSPSPRVLKDLNWISNQEALQFGPMKKKEFLEQLQRDVKLLVKLNTMDYSFLIGFHDLEKGNKEEILEKKKLSIFSPASSNIEDIKKTNPKLLNRYNDLPTIDFKNGNIFYSSNGGIYASKDDDEDGEYIYYMGIIDCLTNYSIVKRLETFWRTLSNDRKIVSAVPPREYGERFLKFITMSMNENQHDKKHYGLKQEPLEGKEGGKEKSG